MNTPYEARLRREYTDNRRHDDTFEDYLVRRVEAQDAELARLRAELGDTREELMWSAYAMGEVRDGRWSHLFMSDGEWLARELGLDPKQKDYDDAVVKEAIPIKARALAGSATSAAPCEPPGGV